MGTPNLLFGTIKSGLTEKPSSRMPICRKTCKQTLSNAQPRPWKNTTLKKTSRFHQKRIRQKIQPNLALHCWPQLWQLRYPRDQALYLFLFGTGCYSLVQIWISEFLPKLSARQQRSHLIHHLVVIPLKVNQLSLCNINKYY